MFTIETIKENGLHSVSFLTGLIIALIGLANVLPTYDILPRLGPFPLEWFRPLFFWLCLVIFFLSDAAKRQKNGGVKLFHLASYLIGLILISYVSWDYYVVSAILSDSVIFFETREAILATVATLLSLWACWRLWGAPIAILGATAFVYLATGQYWPGILGTVSADIAELIAQNIWYDAAQGILGNIMGIVLTTVLPFIILGAILDGCGAGGSIIRISFYLMRGFKGGPAYAAIAASALFGTVSGSAVANVVGTGVVTIPMIRKRGFSANFAGAVEATASTGGQILPPIMGAAALVMADIVGVSYLSVVTAVLIPAIAYYASLFLSVYFEAQKLNIVIDDDEAATGVPARQDWLNIILVFAPIGIIVWLLLSGLSPAGASIAAILLLIPLSFINPEIRRKPFQLLLALSNGGKTIGHLAIAIAIVGIVVSTLAATGIPTKFAVLLSDTANLSKLFALLIAATGCIVLGMGMPTLPAYIAIVAVMGPTLQSFGVELLTAHMFVFMFGVASVITPPVAIAAYAAASISGGKPIGTAVQSTRIGAMIFLIPFAFVFNPTLLLGSETGGSGNFTFLLFSLTTLLVALYMCTSAIIGVDRGKLVTLERLLRFGLAITLLSPGYLVGGIGLLGAFALIARRYLRNKNIKEAYQ